MLVKGRVVKVVDKTTHRDNHDPDTLVERFRDRYVTTVATLSAYHGLEIIQDTERLTEFMKAYGDRIAAHILEAYQPLYDLKSTEEELAILERLGKRRKPLPGQAEPGLLPTQKHAAIAAARAIRSHRTANTQGEMGAGKTTIGLGVIELLDACPAIVICPPHLVPKWIREAEEVIPGVTARELRRIGKSKDGDVNDVRTFLDGYDSGKLGHKAIAVVASTAAKMGAGWRPVARAKTIKINGKPLVVYTCPQCGQMQTDKQGVPVTEIEYSETRRWSIAEYIKDKAHGRFRILIGDECHEYKSKSSDRGVAFHQLAEATQYTLWLQWALARPNSAFRDELVKLNHAAIPANQLAALAKELLEGTESTELVEKVAQILLEAARTAQSAAGKREKEVIVQSPLMPLPAVLPEQLIEGNLLPKERWLASFCQSEKARRRRVLVYVRQTGTRDIQDRVESVLRQAGLRAITLYGSVSPRKREAWIERHADADVLITNPRLV